MVVRRLWLLAATVVLLAGCGSVPGGIEASPPTPKPEEAVARITYRNGAVETISSAEFERFQQQLTQLTQFPVTPEIALNQLILRHLLLRQARITDVVADGQEIQRVVDNIRQSPQLCGERVQQVLGDARTVFDQCAKSYGFEGEIEFRNFIAQELTVNQVARQEAPKDLIRVERILFTDYEQAAQTYDRITSGGSADFEPVPPFNQEGLTEQSQPVDQALVRRAWELRPQFEQTGRALSEPFQTEAGWEIIRVVELEASQQSVQQFQEAVLERARNAEVAELQQPDTGAVPLLGVVEILQPLPSPEGLPPAEPVVPEPSPQASPEASPEASPAASPEAGD